MSTAWSFACLCALLVVVPGPATLLVGKNAALRGLSSAMTTALGVFTADLVWMTASVIGLTAVLVAFEPAFLAVRLIGSAYLIVLGLRLLFSRDHGPSEDRSSPQRVDSRRAFREGVACDLSNPKTLLVFTSLIPQFLSGSPEPWQLAAYGTAFATMGLPSLAVYAVVFSRPRAITQRPRACAWFSRVSGVILIGFGGRLATEPVRSRHASDVCGLRARAARSAMLDPDDARRLWNLTEQLLA